MAVGFSNTNKPLNPRGNDASPKGYNRAELYSGKALDFDGVNDEVTTGKDLGNLQTLSVAMHCRIDNFTDGSGRSPISQWHGSDGWMIYKSGGGSELIFYRNSNFFAWSDSAKYSDQWIHLVYVIEQGVGAYVYANGQLVASDTTYKNDLDYTNAPTLKIGSYGNTSGGFINGAINGVKIFNTALTTAQVADLYNNPEKIVPTGVADSALKLWLPMQEGAGTTCINGAPDALGSELVTNGTFDTDSDWIKGTGTTISGGKANFTNATAVSLYQNIGTQSGKVQVSFNVSNYSSGTLNVYSGGNQSISIINVEANADGLYNLYVERSSGNANIIFGSNDNFTGSIDDVSVKEVSGYGTINGATWTHGIGAPVAQTSVIDWNKRYFENVDNVLIPQGLTAGRDLLGNLFENVRKQGALNLDGNSWAEVHDNASLDFGTGSFSLEAWAKAKYVNQGSVFNMIISLGGNITSSNNAGLMLLNNNVPYFIYSNPGASTGSAQNEGDWLHIVGTYDETNTTLYVNGSQVDQDARTAADITNGFVKNIGRDGTDPNRYYQDQIAQPRIYNRALTAAEVLQNYNSGKSIYTNS